MTKSCVEEWMMDQRSIEVVKTRSSSGCVIAAVQRKQQLPEHMQNVTSSEEKQFGSHSSSDQGNDMILLFIDCDYYLQRHNVFCWIP